ncbi:MAG: M20/M25/M40 family metallo-hydrolase [Bacteroidia bacterium]|nr:M20/M25/M40 family metallo-hydrolase [Bacteroidia bacterium]
MKKISLIAILAFLSFSSFAQIKDSISMKRIFDETLLNGNAYQWLYDLTENIGPRLAGSKEAGTAVEWAKQKMIEAGADSVYLEPVMVPHWVRGPKEVAQIIEAGGNKQTVQVIALGNSVATPKEGLTAGIIEVQTFDELEKFGRANVEGKIVFFNHPFDERFVNTFEAYGEAVDYRWKGPSEAARYGAVGSICRSMTNAIDDYPHTGSMRYNDSLPKIPCIAISTVGANLLSKIYKANKDVKFFMQTNCEMKDSVLSYNVIGEIKGSEKPNEYIVVGGHLDSWDNCKGAHDDGAGIVQSIQIIKTLKALNMQPKRTIRIVAFMNEENGLRGGRTYANNVGIKNEKHVAAIESDAGGFLPLGFGLNMPKDKKAKIKKWAPLFLNYGIYNFSGEGDGADISALEKYNIPLIGLHVNSQRYFDYHHAASDTIDKVNKRELLLGSAAMGSLAFLLAEYGLN